MIPVDGARGTVAQYGQRATVGRGDDVAPTLHVEGIDFPGLGFSRRKLLLSLESRCSHPSGIGRRLIAVNVLQGAIHGLLLCQLLGEGRHPAEKDGK